jgi:hypothetical protein
MALAAQLASWAAHAHWSPAASAGCCGELGGALVTLRATPLAGDDEACELALSDEHDENTLRLSLSLSTPPFLFALDEQLTRLAECTNEALERSTQSAGRPPLLAALDALCAAAARAPKLVTALRAADATPGDGGSDSDAGDDGWYGDDLYTSTKVRARRGVIATSGPLLTCSWGADATPRAQLSGSDLGKLQASFLFTHAAQASAACASAPLLSTAALPHLRVQPHAEACAVHGWLEILELPTPGTARALGLNPDYPLRLTLAYNQSQALACACAAEAFEGAEFSWEQPEVPKPALHEGVVLRFGLDVFLPQLAKDLSAKWRAEVEASPAKRSRRASNVSGNNAFVWLLAHVWEALAGAASNCAVCRTPLPAPGARLAPCSRDVCLFNFEEMGGCPLLPLLREAGGASAALHCTLANAAASSSGRDTFEPFPSFLLENRQTRQRAGFFDAHAAGTADHLNLAQLTENKNLGRAVIVGVLTSLPPLIELAAMPDEASLRRRLLHHNWWATASSAYSQAALAKWPDADVPDMAWRVLQFVLSTPRVQLQLLAEDDKLKGMPETAVQLAIVGNSDSREQTFQARREAAGGSFFAWHGSHIANWYSITRNGLRSLSGSAMMANGAAYGSGVYLASNLQMSMGYTGSRGYGLVPTAGVWQRAAIDFAAASVDLDVAAANPVVLALCEVTNTGPQGGARVHTGMYVVGTDDVALRYLLLVPSAGNHAAEASALRWNDADVGQHIAALRTAALEAAEAERAVLREPRRKALQAAADQAGSAATVDAAMARLENAVAAQATTAAASATAARAVLREYRELDRVAPALGIGLSLTGDEDVFRWRILMHDWASLSPDLHDDLRAFESATGLPAAIELELAFSPEHFPYAAPFVRVVRPMFAFRTGHVTVGGSICMELLTSKGWSCAVSLESVMVTVRADMVEGGARLDRARFNSAYSEGAAKEAFKRVAQQHGWER